MGNAQARRRIKASDFDYLAKNTNFLTLEVGGMAQPPWLKAAHKHTPVDKEEERKNSSQSSAKVFSLQVAEGYFSKITEKNPGGQMEKDDFVEIFHVAFPSRSLCFSCN